MSPSAAASTSSVSSVVGGCSFDLTPENDAVQVDCRLNGSVPGGFSLRPLELSAERTLGLWLARLPIGYGDSRQRELDAARVVAEARRLILLPQGHSGADEPQDRAGQFLASTDLADRLREDMIAVGFRTDPDVRVTLYLTKISALLSEPVYVYLTGPASSLKTTYADLTASLTPPEMCKHLTDLTPKALYYGQPNLEHLAIFLDEMDLRGKNLAMDKKVLRMLFSKGWCEIEVTRGGKSVRRHVRGPVQVTQTTTAVEFDEQDLSRHLLIELADTPERTDSVLTMMGEAYAGAADSGQKQSIIETHRAVHRQLPCDVDIDVPFAPVLARLLPRDRIVVLRAFRTTISLIKASALLHIRQRESNTGGRIQATLDDYRLVYQVAGEFIAHGLSGSNAPSTARKWVEALTERIAERAMTKAIGGEAKEFAARQRLGEQAFLAHFRRWDAWLSIDQLVDLSGRPRTTVQRNLEQLGDLVERQKVKRAYLYRLATPDGRLPDCPRLPSPEEVERGQMGTCPQGLATEPDRLPTDQWAHDGRTMS